MGHPCEEYNGEGYLLKIDFGEGRSKVGQPCGEIGLRWNRLSKKWVLGMIYYTLVGKGGIGSNVLHPCGNFIPLWGKGGVLGMYFEKVLGNGGFWE